MFRPCAGLKNELDNYPRMRDRMLFSTISESHRWRRRRCVRCLRGLEVDEGSDYWR